MILPLPLEQCRAVVESLGLPYPLYANPDWSVFETYGTGHVLYAPKQTWFGVDAGGDRALGRGASATRVGSGACRSRSRPWPRSRRLRA